MIPPNALPPWIWPPDRINQFVRSLLGRGRLRVQEWSEDECTIPLWWGPTVTIGITAYLRFS